MFHRYALSVPDGKLSSTREPWEERGISIYNTQTLFHRGVDLATCATKER